MNKDNYIHTPYNDEWIAQRADPFVYRHTDGTCYFTASVPAYDRIILRAANDLGGLVHAEEKTLWVRHESGLQSIHIWAPEIHYLFGGWYIYYAAGDKDDIWNIRPYVLHCKGQNPMKDEWEELGMMQVQTAMNFRSMPFLWTRRCLNTGENGIISGRKKRVSVARFPICISEKWQQPTNSARIRYC